LDGTDARPSEVNVFPKASEVEDDVAGLEQTIDSSRKKLPNVLALICLFFSLKSQGGALDQDSLESHPEQIGPREATLLEATDELIAFDLGLAFFSYLLGVEPLVCTGLGYNLSRSTRATSNHLPRLGREGV
jgi:hypothetical protein